MESVLRTLFATGGAQNLYIIRSDENASAPGSTPETVADAHQDIKAAVLSLAKESYVPVREVCVWNTSAELLEEIEQRERADVLLARQRALLDGEEVLPATTSEGDDEQEAAVQQQPTPDTSIAWGQLCKRKMWIVCPFGACSDRQLLRSAAVEVLCARTYQCHPSFRVILLCTQKEFDRLPRAVRVLSGTKFAHQRYAVIPRHYCRYFCSSLAVRMRNGTAATSGATVGGSNTNTLNNEASMLLISSKKPEVTSPGEGDSAAAAVSGEAAVGVSIRVPADIQREAALAIAREKKEQLELKQKQRIVSKPEYIDEVIEEYLSYEDCEISADAPELADYQEQVFNSDPRIRIVKYDSRQHGPRGDVFIRIMQDALKFNIVVHTLDLSGSKAGDVICRCLTSILHTTRKLHHLNLSECSITDAGVMELAAALRKNEHIWTLNLSKNPQISDVGIVALTTVFGPGTHSRLEGLDLSLNNAVYDKEKQWSRAALNTLWEALPMHPFLKYVSIAGCGLTGRNLVELAVRWLGKYRRVTQAEFEAEHDPNEDYHTAAIKARREKKKRLALQKSQQASEEDGGNVVKTAQQELEEAEEELLDDVERAERDAARRVADERLKLEVNNKMFEAGLISLNVSDNPIGDAAMSLFLQYLPLNLKRLNIQHTSIGASGLRALGFAIVSLSLQLEEVNVSQNNTSMGLRRLVGDLSSSDSDDDANNPAVDAQALSDANYYRSSGSPVRPLHGRSEHEKQKRWESFDMSRRGKMLLQRAIRAARVQRDAADPAEFIPPTLRDSDWARTIPDTIRASTVSKSILRASESIGTSRWDEEDGPLYHIYVLSPTMSIYQRQTTKERYHNHAPKRNAEGIIVDEEGNADDDIAARKWRAAAATSSSALMEILREELTMAASIGTSSYNSVKMQFTTHISPAMRTVLQSDAVLHHYRENPSLFEDNKPQSTPEENEEEAEERFAVAPEVESSPLSFLAQTNVIRADINEITVSKLSSQEAFIEALEGNFTLHTLGLSKVFLADRPIRLLCDQIVEKRCGVRCLDISFNREIGEDSAHKIKELLIGGYFSKSGGGGEVDGDKGTDVGADVGRNLSGLSLNDNSTPSSTPHRIGDGVASATSTATTTALPVPSGKAGNRPPMSPSSPSIELPIRGVLSSPNRISQANPKPNTHAHRHSSVGFAILPDEQPTDTTPTPSAPNSPQQASVAIGRPDTSGSGTSMVQFSTASRPQTSQSVFGGFGEDVLSMQSSTASMSSFYPDEGGTAIETDVGVLQSLSVRGNVADIGERAILALYENSGLIHLDVRDMGLTDAMFQPLGDAVNPDNAVSGGGPTAAIKAAAGRLFNPELCLRSVLLSRNTVYRSGMKSISEFIRHCSTLEYLCLSNIWSSFVDDLGNASSLSKTKKEGLWFFEPLLEVLSGGSYSCALLKSHSTVSSSAAASSIPRRSEAGAAGKLRALSASALGAATSASSRGGSERSLYMCPSLRILDLSKNDIPPVVAEELLKSIGTNEMVERIVLADNPLLMGEGTVVEGSVADQKGFTDFSLWLMSEDIRFSFEAAVESA